MKHQKLKLSKIKWLLPLLVLIIGGSILYTVAHTVYETEKSQVRTKAQLNAVTYADRMIEDLNGGINITNALEQILISEDGKMSKFDAVADRMMTDFVQSIQLAPDGVVTEIYPAEGNEAGKIDLVHDEKRGPIVNYGIENNLVVLQGPFDLNQGGQGIAIRNPVYLTDENGEEYFWGLTIAIIKVPEIFSTSISALTSFDYRYVLSKTVSPLSDEYKVIDSSGVELENPVEHTFELGGCTWKIEVMPTGGWNKETNLWLVVLCGCAMILLLEGLTIAMLIMEEQGEKFKKLSRTDGLTGLLNRGGFDQEMRHYLDGHGRHNCVGILLDVDNFKFINDIYGHALGDQVLCQLAQSMRQTFDQNAILGRNGGDEFCILLKDSTCEDAAGKIEAFCKERRTFLYKEQEHTFTVSLGYAEYPTHTRNDSDLLRYADMALYEVKLRGKNGCLAYQSDFHAFKRTQLGFKLTDLSGNLPGAFVVYKADREDERILYANRDMIYLTGCDDLDDFLQFTDRQFRNLVHPEEYERVEESIWRQIESTEDSINDYVKYRLARKDGSYRQVLDFGRIVQSEHYGSVFYVLIMDLNFIREHYGSEEGVM